jgi:hypothetical protein
MFADKVKCQTNYFRRKEHQGSIYHNCAAKGTEEGAVYWYKAVRDDVEFANAKEKLQVQKKVDSLVRRLWRELIAAKGKEKRVYIEGHEVHIPAGLGSPTPEGVMVEHKVVPGYRSKTSNEELPNQEPFKSKEAFFEQSDLELGKSDPAFHNALIEDPVERCHQNRVVVLHQELKPKLESCTSVAEFKSRARSIVSGHDVTLEELEMLDRVLFDLTMACGITQNAVKLGQGNKRSSLMGLARADVPIDPKSALML